MRKLIIQSIIIALTLFTSTGFAETLIGRIVGVTDGDTVTLLDESKRQYKIRLSGIDAPEKAQPFGQVSKKALSDLIYDKNVQVEYSKYDRYGRVIGKIILDKADINLEQLRSGFAWHYKKYQNEQPLPDQKLYAEEEDKARSAKIGLWQEPNATPPWDWRGYKYN